MLQLILQNRFSRKIKDGSEEREDSGKQGASSLLAQGKFLNQDQMLTKLLFH